ncbi:MAG TPA: hypothetical protein VIM41_07675 [Gammaproteobacteria bacterium]
MATLNKFPLTINGFRLLRESMSSALIPALNLIMITGLLLACGDKSATPSSPQAQAPAQQITPLPAPPAAVTTPPKPALVAAAPAQQILAVTSLQEQGAVKLNSNEILELITGHSVTLQHLGSGEYIEAVYLNDGRRSIVNIDAGSIEEEASFDKYVIRDNLLHTEFKGNPVAMAIYRWDDRYLGAADSDHGMANYEFKDIVTAPLTVQVLKSQNAKILSSDEIKQLFIGKNMMIRDLLTGDEYNGFYGNDGMRVLQIATTPSIQPGDPDDLRTRDAYKIENDRLYSVLDGNEVASTIYELETHYYGAMNIDDGAVNYEFIPQGTTQ